MKKIMNVAGVEGEAVKIMNEIGIEEDELDLLDKELNFIRDEQERIF